MGKLTLMVSKLLEEYKHNVLKDPKIESSKTKASTKNKHVKSMTNKVVLGHDEDDVNQNHDEESSPNKT